ncbi:hypothetical protein ACHAPJ_004395 [Fusarium lateritium]
MSTPGQAAQPTEQPSAPSQASAPASDNNSDANQPSAPADDSSAAPAAPTSAKASDTKPSATDDKASAAPTDAATEEPTDAATQASDDPSPSETAPPAATSDNPSPSSENNPSPTQTQSNKPTQADPTTAAPDPSSTDDSNNDASSTDDSEPSASDITTSEVLSTIITVTGSQGPETSVVLVTAVRTQRVTASEASASATSTDDADAIGGSGSGGGDKGLSQKSKVAIGVAVPIAAIAILALLGLFWWKKRKTRRQAEEERRKEVEDYAYNPNADPTIPAVGMADGGYEMREDGSSGYRGWGNTTLGSTGRKASTTLSGGVGAYSDITSPTRGNMSDGRSGEPLMDGSHSPEGEILGAMGPSTANNRGADVHRGPSNASSSYSAAGRSDASDPMGVPYGTGGAYYDQYNQNPYNENGAQQAIIRDNPARRNTRIENPAHYPQQSAGISQNF